MSGSAYRVMPGAALTVWIPPAGAKEIVCQAVPYVGVAKVFDFLIRPGWFWVSLSHRRAVCPPKTASAPKITMAGSIIHATSDLLRERGIE